MKCLARKTFFIAYLLVCPRDGIVHVLDLLDGLDGAEDLLPADLHVVGDVAEDGGLHEVAGVPVPGPARQQPRPLLLPGVNIAENLENCKN